MRLLPILLAGTPALAPSLEAQEPVRTLPASLQVEPSRQPSLDDEDPFDSVLGDEDELDVSVYYVDHLSVGVPSHVRADVRFGWNPKGNLRLSVGVQGLFHDEEQESAPGTFSGFYGAEALAYIKLDLGF